MKQFYKIKDAESDEDVDIEFASQEEFERYLKGETPILKLKEGTGKVYEASFIIPPLSH